MAGRTGAGIANQDLSAASGEEGQYTKGDGKKDRWEYRRSRIGWRRWRWSSCWSRSWKRTCRGTIWVSARAQRARRNPGYAEIFNRGYKEVVDADLSSYFDTIPHHELMQSVARRVSDGAVLALVKRWLEMAVEEEDSKGNKQRSTSTRTKAEALRKERRSRRYWPICTCAASLWDGRHWGGKRGCKHASSTTQMTS